MNWLSGSILVAVVVAASAPAWYLIGRSLGVDTGRLRAERAKTARLRWALGEAEALVGAERHRYLAALEKDPAAPYDNGAIAEAYGMLSEAVKQSLKEETQP
jgi:hypothetical protein